MAWGLELMEVAAWISRLTGIEPISSDFFVQSLADGLLPTGSEDQAETGDKNVVNSREDDIPHHEADAASEAIPHDIERAGDSGQDEKQHPQASTDTSDFRCGFQMPFSRAVSADDEPEERKAREAYDEAFAKRATLGSVGVPVYFFKGIDHDNSGVGVQGCRRVQSRLKLSMYFFRVA